MSEQTERCPECGKILPHLFRRSPVSPPEDVAALLAEANENRFTVGPDMGICAADGVHGTPLGEVLRAQADLVQRLATALRAVDYPSVVAPPVTTETTSADMVTTVEELDALGDRAVVLDAQGDMWQRRDKFWYSIVSRLHGSTYLLRWAPFRVLYRPEDPR